MLYQTLVEKCYEYVALILDAMFADDSPVCIVIAFYMWYE